jgi:hypothetical protein
LSAIDETDSLSARIWLARLPALRDERDAVSAVVLTWRVASWANALSARADPSSSVEAVPTESTMSATDAWNASASVSISARCRASTSRSTLSRCSRSSAARRSAAAAWASAIARSSRASTALAARRSLSTRAECWRIISL